MTSLRLEARSASADTSDFAEAFAALPEAVRFGSSRVGLPPAVAWKRFLDLAPSGAAEFWVAYDGARAVGRVGANVLPTRPEIGAAGFFEAEDGRYDVAHALLDAAAGWLRASGRTEMVGPVCLSTWFPYRFRLDDHDLAFPWEPSNPPSYPGLFERYGFETVETYQSTASANLQAYADKTEGDHRRAVAAGFTFRPLDAATVLEHDVQRLYDISIAGFSENYLFEPIAFEAFRELYVPLVKTTDFSCAHFAVSPEGNEVGFFFCFPEGDAVVLKSVAVVPEARGLGLSNALSHLAAKRGLEKGLTGYVAALVRVGAQSESYARKTTSLWTHRYALYRKAL